MNTVSRIGEQLSISDIMGHVVTLSDHSSFAVRFIDRWKLWRWSPEQKIVITSSRNKKYPYKISNTDVSFGKEAVAQIETRRVPPEIPDDVA